MHCAECFTSGTFLKFHMAQWCKRGHHPHFKDSQTKVQRGKSLAQPSMVPVKCVSGAGIQICLLNYN